MSQLICKQYCDVEYPGYSWYVFSRCCFRKYEVGEEDEDNFQC